MKMSTTARLRQQIDQAEVLIESLRRELAKACAARDNALAEASEARHEAEALRHVMGRCARRAAVGAAELADALASVALECEA